MPDYLPILHQLRYHIILPASNLKLWYQKKELDSDEKTTSKKSRHRSWFHHSDHADELRRAPDDGKWYTEAEFYYYYRGYEEWDAAAKATIVDPNANWSMIVMPRATTGHCESNHELDEHIVESVATDVKSIEEHTDSDADAEKDTQNEDQYTGFHQEVFYDDESDDDLFEDDEIYAEYVQKHQVKF